MRKTTRRVLTATATSAAAGIAALAPATTAGAAPEATSVTAEASAAETNIADEQAVEPQAGWKYDDWYYFKADCQDWGRWLATEPIADNYDHWKCVYRGTWPTDYYDLFVK